MSVLPIEAITKLNIQPGNTVVVKVSTYLKETQLTALRARLKSVFKDNKVQIIILGPGVDIQVKS